MNKTIALAMAAGLVAQLGVATQAALASDLINGKIELEIAVEKLLTPSMGYEEKNDVQVVLYGFLPNVCYTLGGHGVREMSDGKTIQVRQYAMKDVTGICAEEANLPEHMKLAVPFTKEISIGRMKAGTYTFLYEKAGAGVIAREMTVSENISPSVDTLPYAAVTSVEAPDVVNGKDSVMVKVKGVLNSTCTEVDDQVRVQHQDDVIVLLPVLKVRTGVMCMPTMRSFEKTVDLGTSDPGIHLIHTRSMNGHAINKVLYVAR